MKIHNVTQGSAEWKQLRANYFTASEAPAMLGLSKYKTRDALLAEKATGITEEIDAAKQALFDRGHEAEAKARVIAEEITGEDLFPATGTAEIEGINLLASFDGLSMDESICWENKLWNAEFAAQVEKGIAPDTHWPQMEQQLLISGASKCLFTVSDGTKENTVSMWYESSAGRRAMLIAGWRQFAEDLKNYVPTEQKREAVAAPQETLPTVGVTVGGSIQIAHNLDSFGSALKAYVDRMNQKPQTDDDFATLEKQAKDLKAAEDALTAAESNALAQVSDVDTLRRTIASYKEIARQARLTAEKVVKAEKENRKTAIVNEGNEALQKYITELTVNRLPQELPMLLPTVPVDFFGVIRGLKTIASVQNAVNTELARAKAAYSVRADEIAANLRTIAAQTEYKHLFVDYRMLALKQADDLQAVIDQRISAFKAEQQRKEDEMRARIVAEEIAKAEQQAAQATVAQNGASSTPSHSQDDVHSAEAAVQQPAPVAGLTTAPVAANDNGARITLSEIKERLGFTVTEEFLMNLGFFAKTADRGNGKLYKESEFPMICHEIGKHCIAVANTYVRKAA